VSYWCHRDAEFLRETQRPAITVQCRFSPFDPRFSPFNFFHLVVFCFHANLPIPFGPSFRPNFYGRTTIMRRSIQLDRTEALPVKTIHRSGLVYSARYR
jgi:hypothetical protein